jgi:class 3 adenylate cyclase
MQLDSTLSRIPEMENSFPPDVVDRLKRGSLMAADYHPETCILVAKMVGVTKLTNVMSSHDAVRMLHLFFSICDRLVDKYQLIRVENTACMYVAAARTTESANAATRMVQMALDVVREVDQRHTGSADHLMATVALHMGSTHSGVVGEKVPRYFVLGAAVDTAVSMLESTAPCCIHMSVPFYAAVDTASLPEKFRWVNTASAGAAAVSSYIVPALPDNEMPPKTLVRIDRDREKGPAALGRACPHTQPSTPAVLSLSRVYRR